MSVGMLLRASRISDGRVVPVEVAVGVAVRDDLGPVGGVRRRGGDEQRQRRGQQPEHAHRMGHASSPFARRRQPGRAAMPAAQSAWECPAATALAARRAEPRAQLRIGREAVERGGQRGRVARRGRRARCARAATRPPAAAPTAVVAITGTPWSKASLTTNPHGSRKSRVGIDGTTTTSEPA